MPATSIILSNTATSITRLWLNTDGSATLEKLAISASITLAPEDLEILRTSLPPEAPMGIDDASEWEIIALRHGFPVRAQGRS